eukprot:15319791-Heterocapsa_arctica.AAC.1
MGSTEASQPRSCSLSSWDHRSGWRPPGVPISRSMTSRSVTMTMVTMGARSATRVANPSITGTT